MKNYLFNKSLISVSNSSCVGPFGASGAGTAGFWSFAMALTTRKIQNAIIRKSTADCAKFHQLSVTSGIPFCIPGTSSTAFRMINLYSVKFTPPVRKLITGMMTSVTSDVTILPNAPPITTQTARSTTLPRIAKALNSWTNDIRVR